MSPALVEHALSLIAATSIEAPARAARKRNELTRWRTMSPEHEAAYEEALRRWRFIGAMAPELRARFDEPLPAFPGSARKFRSRGALCVAAIVVFVTALFSWYLRQPSFNQSFESGIAQIAKLSLPDGTRVDLNAKSALRVTFYRDRRTVDFKGGEARFEVAADPSKTFQVTTGAGVVEVVGTIFTVRDRGNRVVVEVEQGRVRFVPSSPSAPPSSSVAANVYWRARTLL